MRSRSPTPSRAPSHHLQRQLLAAMAIEGRGDRKVATVSFKEVAATAVPECEHRRLRFPSRRRGSPFCNSHGDSDSDSVFDKRLGIYLMFELSLRLIVFFKFE
ncbi:hypothetical protein TIFTF001_022434 [Ficus carica]|uniref:Uncharacterized protein n=1 Tax=Ficus carica TaxID=3494 RepID=A0AA88AVU6_FICCA|nr:hypothetical protein TIFTF001_022434 [Ficus carica]